MSRSRYPSRHPTARRPHGGVLTVGGAALLTLLGCGADPGAGRLERAVAAHPRPCAGRLSTQAHSYAPSEKPSDRPAEPPDRNGLGTRSASLRFRSLEEPGGGAIDDTNARYREALERLHRGDVGTSITWLESLSAQLDGAEVHSDLAAAYLDRGSSEGGSGLDLLRALRSASTSTRLDPTLPAAWFNLALSSEATGLFLQAREAWDRYLEIDPASEWSEEARRRRAASALPLPRTYGATEGALRSALARADAAAVAAEVDRHPQRTRLWLWRSQLPRWANAADAPSAARALSDARSIADALSRRGDAQPTRVLDHLEQAASVEGTRDAFRRGLLDLAQGLAVQGADRRAAIPPLRRAVRALSETESPLRREATYALAESLAVVGSPADAEILLAETEERGELPADPWLEGRVAWMRGYLATRGSRPVEAVERYRQAWRLMEAAGARRRAGLFTRTATALAELGRPAAALELRLRGLVESVRLGEVQDRHISLRATARVLVELGRSDLARFFLAEMRMEQAIGSPSARSEAERVRWAAELLLEEIAADAAIGEPDRWHTALLALRSQVNALPDSAERELTEAYVALLEGGLALGVDPAGALRLLDRAAATFSRGDHLWGLVRTRGQRAVALRSLGRMAEARTELLRAVALQERIRRSVFDPFDRADVFEARQALFDSLIAIELEDGGSPQAALSFAERSRSRSLLDLIGKEPSGRPDAAARELLTSLPAGTAMLYYAVLEDRAHAWLLRPGSDLSAPVALPVARTDLRHRVDALREHLERAETPADTFRDASGTLYDLLIRPFDAELRESEGLIVVADRSLHRLPFAALFDREVGRYLIEELPIAAVPSAAAWHHSRGLARNKEAPRSVLSVSSAQERGDLPPLPHAARESEEVAALYPAAVLLGDPDATPGEVSASAPGADVLHFATHGALDLDQPAASALLLTPQPPDRPLGALTVRAISELSLERPQLAFLSSCSTLDGYTDENREGTLGPAMAFLVAGVPTVVAARWQVNDESARRLARQFHARYSKTGDASAALRDAQLAFLHGDDVALRHPRHWAVFQVFGAP